MKNYQYNQIMNETPRRGTMKKDQYLREYQPPVQQYHAEDYVQILGKIRWLEDEVIAEKFKNQALQEKAHEYIRTIENLQYQISDLKHDLSRANEQLKNNMEKDQILEDYETNLGQIGQEIITLNSILLKKKNQEQKLHKQNQNLHKQLQDVYGKLQTMRKNEQQYSKQIEIILSSLNEERERYFSSDLLKEFQKVKEGIETWKGKAKKNKQLLEKNRKESSEQLLREKQKIIKLQYDIKLLEERKGDWEKKVGFQKALMSDQKLQDLIEQMLKKEDDLLNRIEELQLLNQELQQKYDLQTQALKYRDKLHIKSLEDELKALKVWLKEEKQRGDSFEKNYSLMVEKVEKINQSTMIEEQDISQRYRQTLDQKKLLQLRVDELTSSITMLTKEIQLFKNNSTT